MKINGQRLLDLLQQKGDVVTLSLAVLYVLVPMDAVALMTVGIVVRLLSITMWWRETNTDDWEGWLNGLSMGIMALAIIAAHLGLNPDWAITVLAVQAAVLMLINDYQLVTEKANP